MKLWVLPRYGLPSPWCQAFMGEAVAEMLIVMLLMFTRHISGCGPSGAARRSSSVIVRPPPVVMLITASVLCLITGRNRMNTAGSGVGEPSCGLRAFRLGVVAPALAAS